MRANKSLEAVICAGLLGVAALVVGCAKSTEQGAQASTPPSEAAAPAQAAQASSENDPVTQLAYKTGVSRDKVAKILEIYEKCSKADDSGRDIYNIALIGSRETGVPTPEVGSVILSYRGMLEGNLLKASVSGANEPPKG